MISFKEYLSEEDNPRIPRKKGQPAKSDKHSDLYTDEDPKGTIKGLGFKDTATAEASVAKIKKSGRSHAHKIQAAIAMEQRARVMGKTGPAAVYRKFINQMKKITKQKNEADGCWVGFKKVGMKKKGDKMVPNCVKEFKEHLQEATGKNTHMTHIEDQVLYGGVKGAREAIYALRSLRDMLKGSSNSSTDVTVKWDGAPAVFAGIDPSDGQFFVAKKGIFNKDPKVYKSEADVRADTSGDLADKLVTAYNELKDIGIQGVIQGDVMFTQKDLSTENIDGESHITFQPNTIVYAIPAGTKLAKTIQKAKLGVVFHTTYKGDSFANMKASFGVDLKGLKKKSSVWYQDAALKDVSGTATFTKKDTEEVNKALSKAGTIFQKISGTTLRQIEGNPQLAQKLEQFNNTLVRKGQRISSTTKHVNDLISWFDKNFAKEADKRKSDRGKQAIAAKQKEVMSFFSKSNRKNLDLIYQLQNAIVDAKLLIIKKLDRVKQMGTFVRTRNGFKVTGSEGFVAIDHSTDGAVKLVDRLEFSMNNFSPNVIKGWER